MAIQNITLNGYNLQDSTVITSKFVHEPISVDEAKIKIPHRDGSKLVSYTYSERPIHLEGWVFSPTASGLDGKVDDFKKNLIGAQGVNLDYDYQGGSLNRRYIVNVKSVTLARDYYNTTAVPYTVECEAINPPFGQDTVSISGIATSTTVSGVGYTTSVTISGTANPQPLIRFRVITSNNLTDIEFKNNTTGTSIIITPPSPYVANDVVEINTKNYSVQRNGAAINYIGKLPTFVPGINNVAINVYNSVSSIIDSQQTQANVFQVFSGVYIAAQTFTPNNTTTYNQIDLDLSVSGTPADVVTVSVYADNNGAPGSQIASTTISQGGVSTTGAFTSAVFATPFSLTAGSVYWLTVSSFGSNIYTTPYYWGQVGGNVYTGGSAYFSSNGGANYAAQTGYDYAFKLYKFFSPTSTVGFGMEYTRFWL